MATNNEFQIVKLWAIVSTKIGDISAKFDSNTNLLIERNPKDWKKYYRLIFITCSLFSVIYSCARVAIFSFKNASAKTVKESFNTVLQIVYILFAIFYICLFTLQIVFTVHWKNLKELFNQLVTLQTNIGKKSTLFF